MERERAPAAAPFLILEKAVSRKARKGKSGPYQPHAFHLFGLSDYLFKYSNLFAYFAPLREERVGIFPSCCRKESKKPCTISYRMEKTYDAPSNGCPSTCRRIPASRSDRSSRKRSSSSIFRPGTPIS